MRQGWSGYYDAADEAQEEGMTGFEFMGDAASQDTSPQQQAAQSIQTGVQPSAAAQAAQAQLDANAAAAAGAAAGAAVAEDHTIRNVAIGGGVLVAAYLAYRHFR